MSEPILSVDVVGGGPAGLYVAILLKKSRPEMTVTVHERNRPGDAFGFGVVFSDETLDHFLDADEPSYRAMTESFRHWGAIRARHPDGVEVVSAGHGFAAISRRALLEILTDRAGGTGRGLQPKIKIVLIGQDGINPAVIIRQRKGVECLEKDDRLTR